MARPQLRALTLALLPLAAAGCGDGFPPRPAGPADAAATPADAAADAARDAEPQVDEDDVEGALPPDAGPPALDGPAEGELLINEIDYATADGAEYIEIVSRADGPRALGGLTLELVQGGRAYLMRTLDAGVIGPGERLLLVSDHRPAEAPPEVPMRVAFGLDGTHIAEGRAGVRLRGPDGAVLDAVGYGGEPGEGQILALGDAPQGSLGRCPDGADTDDNLADFQQNPESSPGSANVCRPPAP